jgi:ribosome modulation factor
LLAVMVYLPGWRHSTQDRRQEKTCRIKALSFLRMAILWVAEGWCFLSVWITRQDVVWVGGWMDGQKSCGKEDEHA